MNSLRRPSQRRDVWHQGLRTLSLICSLAVTESGCAYVEVTHQDGSVSRSIAPLALATSRDGKESAVKTSGLGLAVLNGTTTLGWFDASTVALDPSCHVVLIGNSDEQLRRFAELTRGRDVCSGNGVRG